jgi:AmmeMemoRadiSam system protein B
MPDNTVEIQLPIIKARFPGSKALWLRAPNGPAALVLGRALAEATRVLGRKVACLGSTDLTHYGSAYSFSPAGHGARAESWVRDVNDKGFVDALLAMDGEAVLLRGEEDHSACSFGAAAAALSFAQANGAVRAELLGYASSLDVRKDESFVGYAAVGFY